MAKILNIVESAYRATLEEQDDTVLWLTHMLKNLGADVALLLQGNAVCYLAKNQDPSGLRFGATSVNHPPALDSDVVQLVEKNIPVFAVEEDIRERGLSPNFSPIEKHKATLYGIKAVSPNSYAKGEERPYGNTVYNRTNGIPATGASICNRQI